MWSLVSKYHADCSDENAEKNNDWVVPHNDTAAIISKLKRGTEKLQYLGVYLYDY